MHVLEAAKSWATEFIAAKKCNCSAIYRCVRCKAIDAVHVLYGAAVAQDKGAGKCPGCDAAGPPYEHEAHCVVGRMANAAADAITEIDQEGDPPVDVIRDPGTD